ncbi:MAG TPA: M1 family metallopeptidase [Thermomicrobiales bacterium]|nr:M1 family metallopeptidase [Thermomicrobiales bacterium]
MSRSSLCRILIVLVVLSGWAQSALAQTSTESDQKAALIPSVGNQYDAITNTLAAYTVRAALTPVGEGNPGLIQGAVALSYPNHTGESIRTLPIRLYPNMDEYGDGSMTIANVTVDGEPTTTTRGSDSTLQLVDLPDALRDGETAEIALSFTATIPIDPVQSYGMFQYDTWSDSYTLAHWMPLLAGWDPVAGWQTEPIPLNGDPVFANAATFDVTVTAPESLVFATSGSQLGDAFLADGLQTLRFVSGPSRDFDMTASASFVVTTAMAGETLVRSFARTGFEDGSALALQTGVQAIATFNTLIGTYPYAELDIVQAAIGNGAGGVEFPGMVYIGQDYYDLTDPSVQAVPHLLEFVVAHEVGHQWFYGVVGNNQYLHAFLDEALVNYLSTVYFADNYDAETANQQANFHLRSGYFDQLFQSGDMVVDQPSDSFPTARSYGVIVYGKGALAFMALRAEIGTEAFFTGLQQYFAERAFAVASPLEMRQAFEAASGQDLGSFWSHWFDEPNGRDDFDATDLARLLRELSE